VTARLEGTPITSDAGPLLAGLLTDPRVARTLGGVPSSDALAGMVARQAAHWVAHGFGYWLWRDRATGAVVARGGLHHVVVGGHAEVEVGWVVDAERWGEGLASELGAAAVAFAFGPLDLRELVAFTLPANMTSRRVMEKLGFAREDAHVEHAGMDQVLYRLWAPSTTAGPEGELA
ncbi:MAG: GNAT family N-acetyltransferase, partial [Actinomycetota bacterium]|nr:GNAT family N-acetyltransferase [Actinomycetota bacterium]